MPETLKNFIASARKPGLVKFGIFPPEADLSWIEDLAVNPPARFVHPTTLTGPMDGSNADFALSGVSGDIAQILLFWNGLALKRGLGFIYSNGIITMQPGYIPQPGDSLEAFVW